MGPRSYTHILLLGLTTTLAACDSQAAPEYVGEALITLRGSVEIEQAPEDGELRPALAFFNGETGKVHIVDVVVEGEFPSDFTLRVMEPPPDEAFFDGPDGIRSALGYITAVTAGRPDSFRYATQDQATGISWPAEGVPGGEVTDTQRWWCSGSGEDRECYGELQRCVGADDNVDDEHCDLIETAGDPALKDTWSNFAGLSEDLVLVYLEEPLEADAEDAIRLGLPGLDAGYAVLEPLPEHDPDSEDGVACDEMIRERAHALQEEHYGPSLSYADLLEQGRCGWDSELDGEAWLPCDPRTDMLWERVFEFEPQAAAEIGCRETGTWRVVDEEEREHIEIHIGTGVEPDLFAPDRVSHTQGFAPAVSFGGGQAGYTPFDPCAEPEVEEIAWTQESPLGETPEALFGELEQGCTSTLTWDSETERMITASGSTEVTVEVRIDHDSARYLRFPSLLAARCNERLEIDAELTVRTADGAVDHTSAVKLRPGLWINSLVPLEEHGGSLDVEAEDGEVFLVQHMVSGAGENCTGQISVVRQDLTFDIPGEISIDLTAGGGGWSNSGCGIGQQVLQLSEPIASAGASPLELVERLFGEVAIDGSWKDDGTAARLQLSAVSTAEASVCGDERHVELPVAVTYGTSDGAILEHTAEGHVSMGFGAAGEMRAFLSINDIQECDDRNASLPYVSADCDELHGVTVVLHLRFEDDELAVQDDALYVYGFERGGVLDGVGSGFDTESADSRRTLELEP